MHWRGTRNSSISHESPPASVSSCITCDYNFLYKKNVSPPINIKLSNNYKFTMRTWTKKISKMMILGNLWIPMNLKISREMKVVWGCLPPPKKWFMAPIMCVWVSRVLPPSQQILYGFLPIFYIFKLTKNSQLIPPLPNFSSLFTLLLLPFLTSVPKPN